MFNPLMPDLSNLKNEDIDNKINELMKKFTIAARHGQGGVCEQISILLDAYKEEQRARYQRSNQKLAEQNKHLDDFINVDT
jgi:hypothetical protein